MHSFARRRDKANDTRSMDLKKWPPCGMSGYHSNLYPTRWNFHAVEP